MQYMGGKARIARHIVAAILTDTDSRRLWIEPFVGGGNVMEHAAPHFEQAIGSDIHPDLIMMWQHVTAGGDILSNVTREMYTQHRNADPSWLRGFLGFGASFGGKWFGGYGVSSCDGELWRRSARTVARQANVFRTHRVSFQCANYIDIRPPAGSVIYCDPPYAGTTAYATGSFDHQKLYRVLQDWAADTFVYVSEYQIPADVRHEVIWSGKHRTSLKRDVNAEARLEKLFRILPESWPWP